MAVMVWGRCKERGFRMPCHVAGERERLRSSFLDLFFRPAFSFLSLPFLQV